MSITAEGKHVVWKMTPARARKIASVLAAHTNASSEALRLRLAADQAEDNPA